MEPFSAIGRLLSTRRVSARRQEAEDSREENGIPTPAIAANATNFHHLGAGSVQITKKASPWVGLLCFVFPLVLATWDICSENMSSENDHPSHLVRANH